MISTTAFELYQYAVTHPGWTREDASTALGYTLRDLDKAIEELAARRLFQLPADGAGYMVAISPDVALSQLVEADERLLIDLRTKIASHRSDMAALVPAYVAARRKITMDSGVEVLEDPVVIRNLLIDYGRDVGEQVLIAQPAASTADVHHEGIQKDLELLERGVVRKNLYNASTLDHVPTRKAVAATAPAGLEYRTLTYVPLKLMVFDRSLALVGRQHHPGDRAALVVRDVSLINIFIHLFNVGWDLASPYPWQDEDDGDDSGLTSVQAAVLRGMAAGYSDEVISRRLNISVRTCRRHIAWMLDELGADSRFQAALKARDRGWI
ncbi:response regulator transcription factor [Arthrobacter sp. GCM10027362]|uniref:helix-turn-helix transcriptional regulator n=1 Tax=Arthrobacter sp. GCM10027362 TaxID=3273379 RepID=UPI003636792E